MKHRRRRRRKNNNSTSTHTNKCANTCMSARIHTHTYIYSTHTSFYNTSCTVCPLFFIFISRHCCCWCGCFCVVCFYHTVPTTIFFSEFNVSRSLSVFLYDFDVCVCVFSSLILCTSLCLSLLPFGTRNTKMISSKIIL